MLGLKYYQFLLINIIKKKATWIVGFSYLLIISLLLFIIPLALEKSPFYLWTDAQMSVNLMVMYAGALYSSIIAIFIFRDFNENGTELLIFSKPIPRGTLTIFKFLCYITVAILFSMVASILGCLVFLFPNVSDSDAVSLIVSLFGGNFILIIGFGFVAVLVTLFLNKVWTNLINICLVVIFMIFHMVSSFTVKTPAQVIQEEPTQSLGSFWYLDQNKEMKYGASFNSQKPYILEQTGEPISGKIGLFINEINNIQDVKRIYGSIDEDSKTEFSNGFDIVQQFDSMFNVQSLEKRKERNALESFGNNRWYKYKINENIPAYNQENRPLGYVGGLSTNGWKGSPEVDMNIELGETYVMVGNFRGRQTQLDVFDNSDKMYVGRAYKNYSKSGAAVYYGPEDLIFTTQEQKDWLDDFLFNSSQEKTKGFLAVDKGVFRNNADYSTLLNQVEGNDFYKEYDYSFYRYIHEVIAGAEGKNIFTELDEDPSPATFAIAVLKFKFNCFIRLCEKIEEVTKIQENVLSNPDSIDDFANYNFLINLIPELSEKDKANIRPSGRPLNAINGNDEEKLYFTDHLVQNARAFLDEYITRHEEYGYVSEKPNESNREKDRYVSTLLTFSRPLFKTYLNTMFNFEVSPVFTANQLWAVWGIMSLFLMAIAIAIYYRTDFK